MISRRTFIAMAGAIALFTGCKSATRPAAVAGEAIPDLPDFPGATRTQFSSGGPREGYTKVVKAEYFTDETVDSVKAHYKAAIGSGGWQVTKADEKADHAQGHALSHWPSSAAGMLALRGTERLARSAGARSGTTMV